MTVRSMQSGGKDCKTTALSPVIILSSSMLFSRRGLTAGFTRKGQKPDYYLKARPSAPCRVQALLGALLQLRL